MLYFIKEIGTSSLEAAQAFCGLMGIKLYKCMYSNLYPIFVFCCVRLGVIFSSQLIICVHSVCESCLEHKTGRFYFVEMYECIINEKCKNKMAEACCVFCRLGCRWSSRNQSGLCVMTSSYDITSCCTCAPTDLHLLPYSPLTSGR